VPFTRGDVAIDHFQSLAVEVHETSFRYKVSEQSRSGSFRHIRDRLAGERNAVRWV